MSGWLIAVMAGATFLAVGAAFWFNGGAILKQLVTVLAQAAYDALVDDRMPPEQEAAWRDCQRRGGRWDRAKKRCVEPR